MKSRLTLIVLFACLVIPRPQLAQQQDSPSAYQKAISFALKRQYELAEQSFLEALKEDSTRVDSQYGLARLHAETGHWEKAEKELYLFLSARPRSADGFYLLGYVLYRRGQFPGSAAALQEALQIKNDYAGAHKMLGLSYYQLNKLDLAEREWITATRQAPQMTEAHYFLGRLYYTLNRLNEALQAFEAAIRVDSEYMKAHDNLGLTLEALGRADEAMKSYQRAIELNERLKLRSKWPYLNLGEFLLGRGGIEQSIVCFQKALSVDPNSAKAHTFLGKAYWKQGRIDEALKSFQTATVADPQYAAAHYQLGLLHRTQGRNKEASAEMNLFEAYRNKTSSLPATPGID